MRIAVVSRYFPSSAEPWQGRSAYQTLRLLAGQEDVHVFFPNAVYPPFLKPRSRIYNSLDTSYRPQDVPVSYFNHHVLPLVSRPMSGWLVSRLLLPHIRRYSPDIIFGVFLYPESYAALRIGRALSIPVVAMSIGSDINSIGDRISAIRTRTVLREVDFLVTVSEDLRRKAVTMGAPQEKTRALINGCDLSVFHPDDRLQARRKLHIDPSSAAVVYVGRLDLKKGLRELIEAAVSLHTKRPDLRVYMVGDGPERSVLEALVQASNAAGYIQVLPACRSDDVAVWMTAADLITLPSYMEGCPNVVLEALACGRPVVASDVGGIPEILTPDCGLLVPSRDSAALAEALASVLDKSWDAEAISAHGSRSWNTVATELRTVFEEVLAKRSAGAN